MKNLDSQFSVLLKEIQKLTETGSINILDIGSGSGSYWRLTPIWNELLKTNSKLTLMDATAVSEKWPNGEQVQIQRVIGIAPAELKFFGDDSFDLVVAFDLIEHMEKSTGYQLLYEIDRITRKSSLVFTPNGFVWQPPSINNPFNAHVSGWTPRELHQMGWVEIRGHVGPKNLIGPYGIPKWQPNGRVRLKLRSLLMHLVYRLPWAAFSFTAVSRGKKPRVSIQEFNLDSNDKN